MRRLFLDANVLFTAAHNPGSKAALVIELGARGHWEVIASIYAVAEARHNLRCKYPDALKALDDLIETIAVVPSGPGQIYPVPLPGKDRPILEAAIRHQASYLLTGDVKDFLLAAAESKSERYAFAAGKKAYGQKCRAIGREVLRSLPKAFHPRGPGSGTRIIGSIAPPYLFLSHLLLISTDIIGRTPIQPFTHFSQ